MCRYRGQLNLHFRGAEILNRQDACLAPQLYTYINGRPIHPMQMMQVTVYYSLCLSLCVCSHVDALAPTHHRSDDYDA